MKLFKSSKSVCAMIIVLLFALLLACQQDVDTIVGKWKVNSAFYQASYEIVAEKDHWNGLVLYYFDGTTQYRYDGSEKRYAFTGLKKDQDHYVDGISGASTKNEQAKSVEINKRGTDTLEITTYIMNKKLVEIWTRE